MDEKQRAAALKRGRELAVELGVELTEDKLVMLGSNALRQDEFSRFMNVTKQEKETYYKQVDDWWKQKRGDLATLSDEKDRLARENQELRTRGGRRDDDDDDGAGDGGSGSAGLTEEQLDAWLKKRGLVTTDVLNNSMQQFQSTAIPMVAYLTTLGHRHHAEFGEVLDQNELIKFCQERNVQIDRGGYESYVADMRKVKLEAARTKELEDAKEEGRQQALQEMRRSSGPPDTISREMFGKDSPLRGLSALNRDKDGNVQRNHGPEKANALFGRMVSQKQKVPLGEPPSATS